MDPSAYVDRESWLKMLKEMNVSEVDIRDHRYDCVVHLVSAAKGAEAFYSTDSNSVRSEGLELARSLDTFVMNAWVGHASFQVIDNVSVQNFAEKCDRVVQAVLTRLGLVADHHRYGKLVRKHKFIVKNFQLESEFPVPYRDFKVDRKPFVNLTIRYLSGQHSQRWHANSIAKKRTAGFRFYSLEHDHASSRGLFL